MEYDLKMNKQSIKMALCIAIVSAVLVCAIVLYVYVALMLMIGRYEC